MLAPIYHPISVPRSHNSGPSLTLLMIAANKVCIVNNSNEPRSIWHREHLCQVHLTAAIDTASFLPEPCLPAPVYQSNSKRVHQSSFFSDVVIVDPESYPPVYASSLVKCSMPMMMFSILLLWDSMVLLAQGMHCHRQPTLHPGCQQHLQGWMQVDVLPPFWPLSAGPRWVFSMSQAVPICLPTLPAKMLLTAINPTFKSGPLSTKLKNQWFTACLPKISWKMADIYHLQAGQHSSAFKMSALTYAALCPLETRHPPTWNKAPTLLKKLTNIKEVKWYLIVTSIFKDGLLVVQQQ